MGGIVRRVDVPPVGRPIPDGILGGLEIALGGAPDGILAAGPGPRDDGGGAGLAGGGGLGGGGGRATGARVGGGL